MMPPEKQHTQVVDNQQSGSSLFLASLRPVGRGWGVRQSPEPTPVGHRSSADAVNVAETARLSFFRWRHSRAFSKSMNINSIICGAVFGLLFGSVILWPNRTEA